MIKIRLPVMLGNVCYGFVYKEIDDTVKNRSTVKENLVKITSDDIHSMQIEKECIAILKKLIDKGSTPKPKTIKKNNLSIVK